MSSLYSMLGGILGGICFVIAIFYIDKKLFKIDERKPTTIQSVQDQNMSRTQRMRIKCSAKLK